MAESTITATGPLSGDEAAPRPGLRVIWSQDGTLVGELLAVTEERPIGRGAQTDGGRSFDDATMSARHAVVTPAPDGLCVQDAGSRNGTWVGGVRVTRATLRSGDTVRVGNTWLEALADVDAVSTPEPNDAVLEELPGPSPALRAVRDQVRALAPLLAEVLILGPPGSGKERVARALHAARGGGPFVALNCATIPAALAESELFGHVRGAFSGAASARAGAFQSASGGTLFLDELGELPSELQPKLLRVLQEGRVQPIGADRTAPVRVRVVGATNRDLARDVAEERFRGDLWSRIARAILRIPPLVARPADITALAGRFLGPGRSFHPDTCASLLAHPWPHGVRDLESVIGFLASEPSPVRLNPLAIAKLAQDRSLAANLRVSPEPSPTVLEELPAGEEERARYFSALMTRHRGNVVQAARAIGRRTTSLYRWLARLGLDPNDYR